MAGATSDRLRILMLPARRNKNTNPYNYLLSTALEDLGCTVDDFFAVRVLSRRYDVLHLHWPEHYAENSSPLKAVARSAALLAVIFAVKQRNGRIIWTVHDVESLAKRNTRLRAGLMRLVMAAVGSFIFMNRSSRAQFFHKFPRQQRKRHAVIPHGSYVGFYAGILSKEDARARLGIATSTALIGMIGDRKRYKNTEMLLRLAGRLRQRNLVFLIAGATQDDSYAAELDPEIRNTVREHGAIFFDRRLSDTDVATCIQACDAIALPYGEGSNTGLGLLALSYHRPVICSDLPVFTDLQSEFGRQWVSVCKTDEDFLAGFSDVKQLSRTDFDALKARLEDFDWRKVAKRTKDFYAGQLA